MVYPWDSVTQPPVSQPPSIASAANVTKDTPPIYLAHAVDDRPVPPENSRMLYAALQKNKVPAEYLELPNGGHGLNGYKGPSWDAWQAGSLEWLEKIKMIPAPTKR